MIEDNYCYYDSVSFLMNLVFKNSVVQKIKHWGHLGEENGVGGWWPSAELA